MTPAETVKVYECVNNDKEYNPNLHATNLTLLCNHDRVQKQNDLLENFPRNPYECLLIDDPDRINVSTRDSTIGKFQKDNLSFRV